ncbi:MAG: hypothetical protein CMJ78_17460 [Planctomycetaceae bacterium]|nr:hypothetical protein [Planctomycetaceae bacterium]
MIRLILSAALVLSVLTSAQAQVKIAHTPKREKGDKIRSVVTTDTKQTLTLGGMDIKTNAEQYIIVDEKVIDKKADGTTTSESGFDVFQVNLETNGIKLEFDKGAKDKPAPIPQFEPLIKLYRALSEAKWHSEVAKTGKINSMKYLDDPFNGLPEEIKKEANADKFKERQDQMLKRYPGKEVKRGDKWTRNEIADFGAGQKFELQREFTYEGTKEVDGKTYDVITYTTSKVDFSVQNNPMLNASDVKLKSTDKSKGEILYDRDLQVMTTTTEKLHITGTLKINANGMEFDGELDLLIESSAKVSK